MSQLEPALIADLLRDSMDKGQNPFLNVISDSMAPLVNSGDQVQIAPILFDRLHRGDVVVLTGLTELLTHRFWGLIGDHGNANLITKGDRPQHFDPPHSADTLVGLVVARRRGGRLLHLKSGLGAWLNRQLTRLAALDLSLFADSVQMSSDQLFEGHPRDGIFAGSSPRSLSYLVIRRMIYLVARAMTFAARALGEAAVQD
jgi:hypothetical protein